jgi:hypothetical protein
MRKHRIVTLTAGLVLVGNALAACSDDSSDTAPIVPAVLDTIPGSDLKQVTLTPDAAERIALETSEVTAAGESEMSVPYGAVIYDPEGLAWAYVVTGDNVYVREELAIDRIEGDAAYLTDGPAVGTPVVVVGVAELFGAETGIGK